MILSLIFTRGISLGFWDKVGNLHREIKPYAQISKTCDKIFFFTYGGRDDLQYAHHLPSNVYIKIKPWFIPSVLYVFIMPLWHRKYFRETDIIKTNQMDGSWAGVIAKRLFKKKLVVRSGYEWLNFLIGSKSSSFKRNIAFVVEKWSYRNADKIIITSIEDRDFIASTFSIQKEKIEVIRNYIDTDIFCPDDSVVKEDSRVIFIGRLEKDKNIEMLLQAVKGLPCELVLIGGGSLKQEILDFSLGNNLSVKMLGRIPQQDLPKELQRSSIFVLPSFGEGNPKALLEAMSVGVSSIGTDAKGTKEVIRDGEDGFLCQLSPESLREKIKFLLENKDARDRLGANAREKIIREYSLPVILQKELAVYKSLFDHEKHI